MLILDRRIGEAVMIADDVTVTVLGVKGRHVRLGFAADSTVPIHRQEIYERIQQERAASRSPPGESEDGTRRSRARGAVGKQNGGRRVSPRQTRGQVTMRAVGLEERGVPRDELT